MYIMRFVAGFKFVSCPVCVCVRSLFNTELTIYRAENDEKEKYKMKRTADTHARTHTHMRWRRHWPTARYAVEERQRKKKTLHHSGDCAGVAFAMPGIVHTRYMCAIKKTLM